MLIMFSPNMVISYANIAHSYHMPEEGFNVIQEYKNLTKDTIPSTLDISKLWGLFFTS